MSELTFDIAHVTVLDPNHYTTEEVQNSSFLLEQATQSFNQLFSQIRALDHDIHDPSKLKLPKDVISLPREDLLPMEKPKTRWERFAELKGIKPKEKETKVFDEATGEWRLRADRTYKPDKEWLIEVPNGVNEDPFAKREMKKKESAAEQKKRERRNKARAERAQMDYSQRKTGFSTVKAKGNYDIETLKAAQKLSTHPGSSASMNQFNNLPNKPAIYEEGSKVPKIIDRSVGKKTKGKKK